MQKNIVVRQQDLKDCGVCSLLSIIKYYGGYIPLEKLRQDTSTSMEGTTAYHLINAAKNYGFDTYGMKLTNLKDLESIILPAIAHVTINNFNHFLVIYKTTEHYIYLMDPGKGNVKMKKTDFQNIWTNNVIVLYPKYKLPTITTKNHLISIIKVIFKRERNIILKIMFWTISLTLITIFTGLYFKIGINLVTKGTDKNLLFQLIFLFISLYFTKFFIYYLRNYFKTILNRHFDGLIYYDFLHHLFLLPNYFVKDRTTGEIMVRIKELEHIKDVLSEITITIFLDTILAISVGIILFFLNKTLFLLLCLFVIVYLVCGIIFGHLLYQKSVAVNDAEVVFESTVVENLDAFITLKNLNLISLIFTKIEKYLFKYLEHIFNLNKCLVSMNSISFSLEELLNFTIISFGFFEILNHHISLIDFITFTSLIPFFSSPFKSIINLLPNYNYVKVAIQKLNDFYNISEEESNTGFNEFTNGDIIIENLNFSYNPCTKIFQNLNLLIKENSFVLFKGPSGCGKSTLCQILSRLKEVKNNNIKIGKVSLNDYSLDTIRKNITYVSQKETLIQDTIKNNILLERNIAEDKLKSILDICQIEEIVAKKPLRYETFLVKDSFNLSGGEKQRLILARALLNDFQILILDEALSELNNELEIKIIQNIKKYFANKTIIYVSHKNHDAFFDKVYNFGGILC